MGYDQWSDVEGYVKKFPGDESEGFLNDLRRDYDGIVEGALQCAGYLRQLSRMLRDKIKRANMTLDKPSGLPCVPERSGKGTRKMSELDHARALADRLQRLTIGLLRSFGLLGTEEKGSSRSVDTKTIENRVADRANILWDIHSGADYVASWIERNKTVAQAESFRNRINDVLKLAEEFVDSVLSKGFVLPNNWKESVMIGLNEASGRAPEDSADYHAYRLDVRLTLVATQASIYVGGWSDEIAKRMSAANESRRSHGPDTPKSRQIAERRKEVARLRSEGLTGQQIAFKLHVTPSTITRDLQALDDA